MATLRWLMLVCLVTLLHADKAFTQWVQTNGPGGGGVNCLAVSPKPMFDSDR